MKSLPNIQKPSKHKSDCFTRQSRSLNVADMKFDVKIEIASFSPCAAFVIYIWGLNIYKMFLASTLPDILFRDLISFVGDKGYFSFWWNLI